MTHPLHQAFRQLLTDHGITATHGVDLMRLIRMLANAYDVLLEAQMRDENLSIPRWRLLMHLYAAELSGEGAVSPTQLSHFQNVSKNTISALLRSLEEDGLIERELDPEDRRQFRIRLSAAGRELISRSTPRHVRYLNELVADLEPDEIGRLQTLLEKLHASLARRGHLPARYGLGETEKVGQPTPVPVHQET
ncbi:MAG: MarR family transcriptional regulator [Caldilineales bacterium]|nr:MarR family transcriptional regulator [Caldilineales bacterium]